MRQAQWVLVNVMGALELEVCADDDIWPRGPDHYIPASVSHWVRLRCVWWTGGLRQEYSLQWSNHWRRWKPKAFHNSSFCSWVTNPSPQGNLVVVTYPGPGVSFFLKIFYCYSITVVCLFSPSLHPSPAETTFAITWMELESIMLSEISHAVRNKYHMISSLTGT